MKSSYLGENGIINELKRKEMTVVISFLFNSFIIPLPQLCLLAFLYFLGFVSFAPEVMLLAGKYHTSSESFKEQGSDFEEDQLDANLAFHQMEAYLKRIAPKVKDSILISYNERHKYANEENE